MPNEWILVWFGLAWAIAVLIQLNGIRQSLRNIEAANARQPD